MSIHTHISPYLHRPLRSLQEVERANGVVRGLTEEERGWIMDGRYGDFEGFPGFYVEMCNAGGPDDRRYHMRAFFNLLREQIKTHGDVAKALEAVEYEDIPAERGYWEFQCRQEREHVSYCRNMVGRGPGW
jgi:hypothetical protein